MSIKLNLRKFLKIKKFLDVEKNPFGGKLIPGSNLSDKLNFGRNIATKNNDKIFEFRSFINRQFSFIFVLLIK